MPNAGLDQIYDISYKASQSVSGFNEGNKSLVGIVQNMPPFTSSAIPANSIAYVIPYNNGNLSGETANNGSAQYPKMTNVSLGTMNTFSSSMYNNYTFNSGVVFSVPTMVFKYVPLGWADTKASNFREATQKIVDTTNFASVNASSLAEQSGSFGLPWKAGTTNITGQSFAGTLSAVGTAASHFACSSSLENGDPIPPGSGSYMVPGENGGEDTAFFGFWVKPFEEAPETAATMWCNNNADGGSQNWNPYAGIQVRLEPGGSITISKGDGTGTASTDRVTFNTRWTLVFGSWNFICIRMRVAGGQNNIATTEHYAWGYIPNGRNNAYAWSDGLIYVSGTGGNLKYMQNKEFVVNPGDNGDYFNGEIGHFYIFAEGSAAKQVTNSQRFQMAYSTDSGSYQLYTS